MARTPPGSAKWPTSDWQTLLRQALGLLDSLPSNPDVVFGGGTALAVHYGHRVSYDVDLFLTDANVLRDLSPARNAATKALLGLNRSEFPGNYLKLRLGEGEIDFILAARRTADASRPWKFEDRSLAIETPWETAIKKIFFRPSTFKLRDIFDLAAVVERNPNELLQSLPEVEDRLDKLEDRIALIVPSYPELVAADVRPTEAGAVYAKKQAAEAALTFISDYRRA